MNDRPENHPAPDAPPMEALLLIMRQLRDPQCGCPWDIEQSFETIAPYTIEEAYEVADAIRQGDMAGLKGELGDLLLQVVYHAQMAAEAGHFAFDDVAEAIGTKMVLRHPHVFGDVEIRSAEEQTIAWEELKAQERAAAGHAKAKSVLADVPRALPALKRAAKMQKRAARVGFDWPDKSHVFDKIGEELGELKDAIAADTDKAHMAEELGDLLFVLANLARHLDIDPETALEDANAKFMRRFGRVEALLAEQGRAPEDSDLMEMDALWNRAKEEERG
jgi:MazG family protein